MCTRFRHICYTIGGDRYRHFRQTCILCYTIGGTDIHVLGIYMYVTQREGTDIHVLGIYVIQ